MGRIWNWIKGGYNWLKNNIGQPIWNGVKGIHGFISGGWHKLDTFLKNASNIPILGSLADLARNNPLYGTINGIIDESDSIMNQASMIGEGIDKLFSSDDPDVEALKNAGGDIFRIVNATGNKLTDLFKTGGLKAGQSVNDGTRVGSVIPNKPGEFIPNTGQATTLPIQTTTPTMGTNQFQTRPITSGLVSV